MKTEETSDRSARTRGSAPRPQARRAAFVFIFITVVLDMLALGMIVPVLPKLIEDFVHGNTARAAEIYGLFGTVWALMQFVFSPVLGALSDRYGRRTVILLSNFGLGLDYIVMALAPTVGWLLLGRVISGITSASFSTASAYIADVTPPEKRAGSFGMLSAAFGLGFILGPALGGVLGNVDPRLPFWVAAGFSLLNAMYGLFVLPESLPIERRERFSWRRANPMGSLKLLRSHAELFGLAGANFIGNMAHEALPTTFVLYAMYRYGWNERTIGLALATVGACSAIVGAGLVQPMVERFGERRVMIAGLWFGVAGFAIYGLAATGLIFWLAVPVTGLWGLSGPPMQGLMTRHVNASEQGQLQGALSSLRGIAFMIGPLLFTNTFAAFIGSERDWHIPGAPYLLAALMLAAATLIVWRVTTPRSEGALAEFAGAAEEA
ncbi:MAG TPA: TCR/Tet family MFS transporter [Candidatus Binataceae bacterium]|nr:TCR/Tet family MFS transporter [Candidatus Binataceae bacterium]